jgi:hypothetical protein
MTCGHVIVGSVLKRCHSLSTLSQLHDSSDTHLRRRHASMARAVLEVYGLDKLAKEASAEPEALEEAAFSVLDRIRQTMFQNEV